MTTEQMQALAIRLRQHAKPLRRSGQMTHDHIADDLARAADLIESMAQQSSRHVALVCPQCHWTLEEREPMTDEQIDAVLGPCADSDRARHLRMEARRIFRLAEKAHGIVDRKEHAA